MCEGNLEVKTSGRYTYELGKALCASPEKSDNDLWIEWYNWSLKLAVQSSFTDDETEKNMARSFITETFNKDEAFGSVPDGTWDSAEKCLETLQKLAPSPNHMVWFEYVLRVFPLCALVPCVQGSSGAVATVQFVWRGHAETPTTRAGPWPDFALRLE